MKNDNDGKIEVLTEHSKKKKYLNSLYREDNRTHTQTQEISTCHSLSDGKKTNEHILKESITKILPKEKTYNQMEKINEQSEGGNAELSQYTCAKKTQSEKLMNEKVNVDASTVNMHTEEHIIYINKQNERENNSIDGCTKIAKLVGKEKSTNDKKDGSTNVQCKSGSMNAQCKSGSMNAQCKSGSMNAQCKNDSMNVSGKRGCINVNGKESGLYEDSHITHETNSSRTPRTYTKYVGKKEGKDTAFVKHNRNCNIPSMAKSTKRENILIHKDEKKKKNPYETSKENKLNVLTKRVRCLTIFENSKDLPKENSNKNYSKNNTSEQQDDPNLDKEKNKKKHVLLLLTRDFRVNDNWSVIYAYEIAKKKRSNLLACTYINRKEQFTHRYIDIKLKVLKHLEENLKKVNIPFYVLPIYMIDELMEFLRIQQINTIVCDFHPLEEQKNFIQNLSYLAVKKKIKVFQVDSHNIIPLWLTSKNEECSARTIRPKIQNLLPTFLIEYINVEFFDQNFIFPQSFVIDDVIKKLTVFKSCSVLPNFVCTEKKAHEILDNFCKKKLDKYNAKKNDPNSDSYTLLLPYINFGILSAQRCVLEVNKYAYNFPSINTVSGKESFNDDIIMRKELADNYCYYNKNYDNFNGGKEWAKESLKKHDADKREHLYDYDDFKNAKTHNDIWNCCQLQLINEGIIHEFLKMYWAKKILNWSENSKTALKYAIKLNEEFAIDGKTSNGYVAIMWSIMGVHDQSWNERTVFGKVRYMNYNGCKRNFDINMYMSKYPKGKENALIVQKIPTMTFTNYIKKRKNSTIVTNTEKTNEKQKKRSLTSGTHKH
ncbi:deoxyribodipyrimidine photo-lyase, putative [Plasmodium malariae]|uniref:Deoxyribodipyrimidine photo-lyase n=1 Tax=Plasmodium malariae TaxID=5858 RepID=A0A1D3RIB7_PLAMA|nr:deoxyribodipyrimidine photo-lyase, putative [Plasmodium malariae]SCN44920.1 deoxyribodipyrimidine photo-lyase, putative [Plasmodium malariae]